jgi:hypothetical protein
MHARHARQAGDSGECYTHRCSRAGRALAARASIIRTPETV